MRIKIVCITFLIMLCWPAVPTYAAEPIVPVVPVVPVEITAEPVNATANDAAATLDFSQVEALIGRLDAEYEQIYNGGLSGLWRDIRNGDFSFDLQSICNAALRLLVGELSGSGALIVQLVVLSVLCLLLTNLQSSFAVSGVSAISRGVVYLVLISIALRSFTIAGTACLEAIDKMSSFLYALAPLLFTLLAASGSVGSVSLFHPLFLASVGIAENVIKVVIVPLVYFSAALGVVSYISPRFNVNKMSKLCRDVGLGLMSIMMTLFLMVLSVAGLSGAVTDGFAVKAAKSASGLFIPIVGKALAESLDTVLATSLLLKNSIGIAGLVIVLLICALPALKVLVLAVIYRVAAALIQPLGDAKLGEAVSGLAGSLTMMFAVLAISGLFFFFVIAITLAVGNISVMFR